MYMFTILNCYSMCLQNITNSECLLCYLCMYKIMGLHVYYSIIVYSWGNCFPIVLSGEVWCLSTWPIHMMVKTKIMWLATLISLYSVIKELLLIFHVLSKTLIFFCNVCFGNKQSLMIVSSSFNDKTMWSLTLSSFSVFKVIFRSL
jgi:hypothetical protein